MENFYIININIEPLTFRFYISWEVNLLILKKQCHHLKTKNWLINIYGALATNS